MYVPRILANIFVFFALHAVMLRDSSVAILNG